MPPWFPTYCGHIVTCIVLLSVLQMFCSYQYVAQFPSPSEPLLMFTSNVRHVTQAKRGGVQNGSIWICRSGGRTFIGSKRSSGKDELQMKILLAIFVEELWLVPVSYDTYTRHAFKTSSFLFPTSSHLSQPQDNIHDIRTAVDQQGRLPRCPHHCLLLQLHAGLSIY